MDLGGRRGRRLELGISVVDGKKPVVGLLALVTVMMVVLGRGGGLSGGIASERDGRGVSDGGGGYVEDGSVVGEAVEDLLVELLDGVLLVVLGGRGSGARHDEAGRGGGGGDLEAAGRARRGQQRVGRRGRRRRRWSERNGDGLDEAESQAQARHNTPRSQSSD